MAELDLTRYRALTFDCYGTLIDWEAGLIAALRPWARRHGIEADDEALLAAHREIEPRLQAEAPGMSYPDVLRGVQRALARRFGAPESAAEADAFARSIRDWPAFPDSARALAYLERPYRLAILSNVDRDSFASSNAKLGVAFDLVVTAQDVGSYKPDPGHFHRAFDELGRIGVARDQILHVAQSLFHDIAPANRLGLASVWIDRHAGRAGTGATPAAEAAPGLRVASLAELVAIHRAQTSS